MASQSSFLTTRFGGYFHRDVPQEDTEITHVGPGTPCGTSLEYGLVSDHGIRCCYHGWLFDIDGALLETPGEPADSTLKDRL